MFQKYRKNIFSQNGEDGVILELLKRLRLKKKVNWCCEFGAWDGKHGSNTFNLVKNFNYHAVYIEGDKKKYEDLLITKLNYPKIVAINKYVSWKKKNLNNLDKILQKTKIVKNFDILSIDIDSYDLEVWKSIKKYRPKIVVIEVNSGVLPGIEQVQSVNTIGNSFTSTVNFATKIKYQLVCHTGNCIFVDKKYFKNLRINKRFANNKNTNYLFDRSWINKKEFILKKITKSILPNRVINLLSYIKFKILKK